jgi:hypothetical protein
MTSQNGGMATGTGGSKGGEGMMQPVLPPEMEVEIDFEQPQASERFVYAANPDTGTVAIIDATSQAIQTVETGDRPTFLRTLAGTDDAIVLNIGSDDATILRSPATGAKLTHVDVVHGANAIAVAPDGKHAVVYFDTVSGSTAAPTGSVLQDVTVIRLNAGEDDAVGMTVGFRPRAVFFAADSSQAYVVTDDGISVLDFATIEKQGTGIARLVSLGSDVDQKELDVSVTPDGKYALAREPGKSTIRLIELSDGSTQTLDLAQFGMPPEATGDEDAGMPPELVVDVSDLDLAPNGKFALAVLRDQSMVVQVPVPGGFDDVKAVKKFVIKGETIGSVSISPQSDAALLYTTAVDIERITRLTLAKGGEHKTIALRKTVKAVTIAPDGETALIIHKKADGDPNQPGLDPDTQIDRSFGYSVLRIPTGDVKLQVTPVQPSAFTMVPDGSFLFLLLRDDDSAVREAQKVEAKSFLVQTIALGSPPLSVGSVPKSERVFVNQDHPDGRITFIDWTTNETRTVTGFELNSRIRD